MSFYLSDRVKELSYTIGTGNIALSGPVNGFSSFSSKYSNGDNLFYAITDGTNYEIGSGLYSSNTLARFPVKSTNSNNLVSFVEGIKEVYVTYPATHAVFNGSGFGGYSVPQQSGMAFWASSNILNYDSNISWDANNHRLALYSNNPQYAIDVGGSPQQSTIRSSGLILGSSGLYFPPVNDGDVLYAGGRQLTHYVKNQLDKYAYNNSLIGQLTGSDAVFQLSGVANQYFLLKQQNAGLVFAGPPSGCSPPCSPGYPSFRALTFEDIPNLTSTYPTNTTLYLVSGYLNDSIVANAVTARQYTNTVSGLLNNDIRTASGALNAGILSTYTTLTNRQNVLNAKIDTVSGILNYNIVTVSGITDTLSSQISSLTTSTLQISGILDTKINTYKPNNVIRDGSGIITIYDNVLNTLTVNSKLAEYITPVGNNIYVSGHSVGVNISPVDNVAIYALQSGYNSTAGFYGMFLRADNKITTTGVFSSRGIYGTVNNEINNGIINSGTTGGGHFTNWRNILAGDSGRMFTMFGLLTEYGHRSNNNSTVTTTENAIGLAIYPYRGSGTIQSAYDIYLAADSLGHGTINTHYGIYQIQANDNYFAGNIGISTQFPTAKLDVDSNKIRLRQSKTPTSATAAGNAGDICWDTGYLYVCIQDNVWKRSALSTWT